MVLDSDSDWYLYNRALTYLALNQPDKARADLALAIKLAKEHFQKDPKDWRNSFNLALYYLAAQYNQPAEQLYRYVLSQGASLERIRGAIQDLNDFLTVFPNHVQATTMQKLLQSYLTLIFLKLEDFFSSYYAIAPAEFNQNCPLTRCSITYILQ